MFHRIRQYELNETGGRWYRPRAYGEAQLDGTWDGWLVFFPVDGGAAIAPPSRETTQSSLQALTTWADGLRPVYLEGALARAAGLAQDIIGRLADSEYAALEDAERLETAAEVERTAADLDEAAASAARAEAERIRHDRLATESVLADSDAAAARLEADELEQRARAMRAVAADAGRGRRPPQGAAAAPKRRVSKKK